MIPKCLSKRELICWLLLFWKFSDKRNLQQSQVQRKNHSTDFILVFSLQRQCLKVCSMFLSHSQALTRQSVHSKLIIFYSEQEWKIKQLVDFFLWGLEISLVRACTQTTQTSHSNKWHTVFLWVPKLPHRGKWWIAPQPGHFLISFHVCSCEWNPDAGESWIQAPCRDPNHTCAPKQVHCFILLQISSLPHKVPSLRVIRLHLQAIRKVSDTY